jgi:predicted AAA+ superfamily ATPase
MTFQRNCRENVENALRDTPIVLLNGARQVGKSTLAKEVSKNSGGMKYFTFDDPSVLSAAAASPVSFVEQLGERTLIDEVQRVPEIFLPLKKTVDEDRRAGRFLLTGSANIMTLPKLADSLAGRMEIQTLWPLSQGEIEGRKEGFIDTCFEGRKFDSVPPITWPDLVGRMVLGGYPEVIQRRDAKRRKAWFSSYISSLLERDVRELSSIDGLKDMPRLLEILATRAGGLQNFSEISRLTGITGTTLKRYVTLLEALFLHIELPGWYRNLEKRLIKAPKTYLNDTGLLCHLRGVNEAGLVVDRNRAGHILENFVVMELQKQRAWSNEMPRLHHFRNLAGREVDVVLETPDGRLVGIEIKASAQVGDSDFAGLRTFSETAKHEFVHGIVLYTGSETLSFGSNLTALPISALWRL